MNTTRGSELALHIHDLVWVVDFVEAEREAKESERREDRHASLFCLYELVD